MVREQLICDGCGKEVILPPGTQTDKIRLNCTVSINCAPDKNYDLCPHCLDQLEQMANPTTWPRPIAGQ